MKWKPAITLRENHIEGKQGVQISDALDRRRFLISKDRLLSAIADVEAGKETTAVKCLADLGVLAEDWTELGQWAEGIDHWNSRNWSLPLSYYLWARRDEFLDEGPNYEEIRCDALRTMLDESAVPLPDLIEPAERVPLGEPAPLPPGRTAGDVLRQRVTTQFFDPDRAIGKSVIAGILKHGFSVSKRYHIPDVAEHIHNLLHGVGFAFDPYIATFNVDGLESGIYYYSISQEWIRLKKIGNFRSEVCEGLIGHQQALSAACTVFLVVDFPRFQWRYRHERALRNLYVDAGRMAQYLLLVCTAYGVKCHITPAARDSSLARLLDIEVGRRQVFYAITLGL